MQTLGFKKVYDLDGGMGAWRNANMPIEMPK
jgi:rhodanese-related sulfurtransferase